MEIIFSLIRLYKISPLLIELILRGGGAVEVYFRTSLYEGLTAFIREFKDESQVWTICIYEKNGGGQPPLLPIFFSLFAEWYILESFESNLIYFKNKFPLDFINLKCKFEFRITFFQNITNTTILGVLNIFFCSNGMILMTLVLPKDT